VADFVKSLPANVLVVLDEAYETFIDVDDFPKSIAAIGNDNVIIMKTFSKVYGLAGLRIGYALGVPELIAAMEKVRQPFNTNMLAQAGAIAVLDDKKFIKKTRKAILEGKKYLYEEFRKMGIAYVPSVANFILFDCGRETTAFFRSCLKFGVIVRDMKQYGLNNYIRVTIGTKKENQRFVKVLKKVLK
jgi:histidinol-phosphate aminotransferase